MRECYNFKLDLEKWIFRSTLAHMWSNLHNATNYKLEPRLFILSTLGILAEIFYEYFRATLKNFLYSNLYLSSPYFI